MKLAQCKLCGRLFNSIRGDVCNQCNNELEVLNRSVREYLRESPKKSFTIDQIADGMDVDPLRIQALLEMGHLSQFSIIVSDAIADEKSRKERIFGHMKSSLSASCAAPVKQKPSASGARKMYGQDRYKKGR